MRRNLESVAVPCVPGSGRIDPPKSERREYVFERPFLEGSIITVFCHGSMGDNLCAGAALSALRRRFPGSPIRAVAGAEAGLLDHPTLAALTVTEERGREALMQACFSSALVVDLRYWSRAYRGYSRSGLEIERYLQEAAARFAERPDWYDGYPFNSNEVFREWTGHVLSLQGHSLALDVRPDDMLVPGSAEAKLPALPSRYVTVNNAAQGGLRQTKCWTEAGWAEVVAWLAGQGIETLQVGTPFETPIPGAISFLGRGSLAKTAALLRGALFHMGPEGGLAHVAHAVGTRALTLFGPTPVHAFAYPGTVAVAAGLPYRPCWHTHRCWMTHCGETGSDRPACMLALTSEDVIQAIRETLL